MRESPDAIGRRFSMLRPYLSEIQRRLWLGAEADSWGSGGVTVVSAATGVASTTVRRGLDEITAHPQPVPGRSRRPGAGRKTAESNDHELMTAFDALIEPDPGRAATSPLRWTTQSIRTMTNSLRDGGHPVSDFVVRRLLHQAGYRTGGSPKSYAHIRGAQFGYVNDLATAHLSSGDPVIMVSASRQLRDPSATEVVATGPRRQSWNGHGDDTLGAAAWTPGEPDRVTAEFTLDAIASWWRSIGRVSHPHASRLMVCNDFSSIVGYRSSWSAGLVPLAEATDLIITSCCLPEGTWRWQSTGYRASSRLEFTSEGGARSRHEMVLQEVHRSSGDEGAGRDEPYGRPRTPTGVSGPTPAARDVINAEWNVTVRPQGRAGAGT